MQRSIRWMAWVIGGATLSLLSLGGCQQNGQPVEGPPTTAPAAVAGQPAPGQQTFATDEEAAKALIDVVKVRDKEALRKLLGPATSDLVSGDPVEDANDFDHFVQRAGERYRLEKRGTSLCVLFIGAEDFPFAIPLVKTSDGKWFFDTVAGKEEILARRIGANELNTIGVCRTYVHAQREYASKDRDGDEVLQYAQRIRSHPGKRDGLYWETAEGEEPSPYGPFMAQATAEGYYAPDRSAGPHPFHGYYFHILKKQGPDAPGGKYDYVINGNMIGGFAMIAWPAEYGHSGVMTFIVSHQGKVYQKDLGPKTAETAKAITEYNPDGSWMLVKD